MGNRVFGVSDLADALSYLYFGLDHLDPSRICDTDIELKSGYSFCRYSTISGLVQFTAKTNLRRTMPSRSMMVVSG